MTDEADRPLTRRERRLREMGQGESAQAQEPVQQSAPESVAHTPAAAAPEGDPVISPFNADGSPRSRREMRMLREQALAAREEAAPAAQKSVFEAPAKAEQSDEADADLEAVELEATQPLSLEDLQEFARAEAAEQEQEPAGADAAEHETAEDVGEDDVVEAVAVEPEGSEPEPSKDDARAEDAEAGADDAAPKKSYSFPDIAPLEDSFSVFDDPAIRQATPSTEVSTGAGDFDDLISRAVAQEGAASTSNTSALILPNLPDTGELSGPIGETGELFITGSIELPKSLGETGGHAPLHDSVEADPLGELGFDDLDLDSMPTTDDSISPVSATRAVSAMSAGDAIVAQETKEKSKLPLVLILTGGGLVVAVGALLIWGASAGMFG
ncbi:MAG: hypothetical protein AB7V10_06640 [Leucobacter sp.]